MINNSCQLSGNSHQCTALVHIIIVNIPSFPLKTDSLEMKADGYLTYSTDFLTFALLFTSFRACYMMKLK